MEDGGTFKYISGKISMCSFFGVTDTSELKLRTAARSYFKDRDLDYFGC